MSNIDNQIVQMRFDNAQFESGVKETLKSLDKLQSSIKGVEENTEETSSKMGEFLNKQFSVIGKAIDKYKEKISDALVDIPTNFVKSVTIDNVASGMDKYADKTKAVQTIMNATGLSIDKVNDQLDKLAWFTDETSYNFVDMVDNVGKFTSMNIPLDQSVTAMQGIATWAAISGQGTQEASRAMYNLSQAMGVGAVKLQDWRSIESANMATSEFRETAIQTAIALGKLDASGKTAKGNLVTAANFSDTLSEEWFTSDVLMAVLQQYGSYADEVRQVVKETGVTAAQAMEMVSGEYASLGERAFKAAQEAKTFEEAIDATRDAVSTGWMNTFEMIFGNYEEAKVLWTDLSNVLYEVFVEGSNARNEILGLWKDKGGRDDLIQGLYDIVDALVSIINGAKAAFHEMFPIDWLKTLLSFSKGVKEFGKSLKEAFVVDDSSAESATDAIKGVGEEAKKATVSIKSFNEELSKGSNGEEVARLQRMLINLGYNLDQNGADGVYGPETQKAVEQFQKDYGLAVDGVWKDVDTKAMEKAFSLDDSSAESVEKTATALDKVEEAVDKLPPGLDNLKNIIKGLLGIIKLVVGQIKVAWDFIKPVLSLLSPIVGIITDLFAALGKLLGITEKASVSKEYLINLWKFEDAMKKVKKALEDFRKGFRRFLGLDGDVESSGNALTWLSTAWSSLIGWLKKSDILDKISGAFAAIKKQAVKVWDAIKKFFSGIHISGEDVTDVIQKLKDKWTEFTKSATFDKISGAFAAIKKQAVKVWDAIKKFLSGIHISGEDVTDVIQKLKDKWTEFTKSATFDKISGAFAAIKKQAVKVWDAIKKFLSGFQIEGEGVGDKIQTLKDKWAEFAQNMGKSVAMSNLSDQLKRLAPSLEKIRDKILELYEIVKSKIQAKFPKLLDDAKENLPSTETIVEKVIDAFARLLEFVEPIAERLPDWLDKLSWVGEGAETILTKVFDFIDMIFGGKALAEESSGVSNAEHKAEETNDFVDKVADLWDNIKTTVSPIADGAKSIFDKVGVEGVFGLLSGIVGLRFVSSITKINKGVGSTVKNASKVVGGFADLGGSITDTVKAFKDVSSGGIKSMFESVTKLTDEFGKDGGIMGALKTLKGDDDDDDDSSQPIAKSILQACIGFAIAIGAVAGVIYLLGTMMTPEQLKQGGIAVGIITGVLTGIIVLFAALHKKLDPGAVEAVGKAFLRIGLAIGLLALAVFALGTMKLETLIQGGIAVAALILVLGLVSLLLGKASGLSGENKAVTNFVNLALAIDLLVIAVAALGKMKRSTLLQGMISLGILMLMLAGFAFLMSLASKISGGNNAFKGMLGMAVAINLLVIPIAILGKMKPKTIKQGLVAIGSLLLIVSIFALFMALISKISGGQNSFKGLFALALAIDLLTIPIIVLGAIKKKTLAQGLFALGAILVMLGLFSLFTAAASKVGGGTIKMAGLIALALAIDLLAIAVFALGSMKTKTLFKGIIAVGVLMLVIGVMLESMSGMSIKSGVGSLIAMIGVLVVIGVLVYAMTMLKDVPTDKLLSMTLGLSAVMLSLGIMLKLLGSLSPAGALTIFLSIIALAAAIGLVIAAFGALASNKAAKDFMLGGAEFIGELIGKVVEACTAAQYRGMAKGLEAMSEANVDQSKVDNALEAANKVQQFAEGLPSRDPVQKATDFFFGTDLQAFSAGLKDFADASYNMSQSFKDFTLDLASVDTAVTAAEMVQGLAEGLKPMTTGEMVFYAITGETPFMIFCRSIPIFANGIKIAANSLSGLAGTSLEDDTTVAVNSATSINRLANTVNGEADILDAILYSGFGWDTPFVTFCKSLPTFASSIKVASMSLYGLAGTSLEEDTTTAVNAATQIDKLASTVNGEFDIVDDVLFTAFKWDTPFVVFCKSIPVFASSITTAQTELDGIAETSLNEDTTTAIAAAANMNLLATTVNKTYKFDDKIIYSVFGVDTPFVQFCESIPTFATSIKTAATELEGIKETKFASNASYATTVAEKIAQFITRLNVLEIDDRNGLEKFLQVDTKGETVFKQITAFGTAMGSTGEELKKISDIDIVASVNDSMEAAESVAGFLTDLSDEKYKVSTSGFLSTSNFAAVMGQMETFAEKISSFYEKTKQINTKKLLGVTDGIRMIVESLVGISNIDNIWDAVDNLNTGLNSIAENESFASSVEGIIKSGYDRAVTWKKDFINVGAMFTYGLAKGVTDRSATSWLYACIVAVVNEAIRRAEKASEVKSPSRRFARIGRYWDEGLAKGIVDYAGNVDKATRDMTESVIEAAKDPFMILTDLLSTDLDTDPVISPVMDITSVQRGVSAVSAMMAKEQSMSINGLSSEAKRVNAEMTATRVRSSTIQNGSPDVVAAVYQMGERIDKLGDAITNMKLVIDSGALVGQIAGKMDDQLGSIATMRGRMN